MTSDKKCPHILFLGPVRATRSETFLPDGIESDGSDKDRYQPDDADLVQEADEDEEVENDDDDDLASENEDEAGFEKKVVASKKGKAKLGRREITAIRTTVPTTGTKSAVEYRDSGRKRHNPSSRSVSLSLGDQFFLIFS